MFERNFNFFNTNRDIPSLLEFLFTSLQCF